MGTEKTTTLETATTEETTEETSESMAETLAEAAEQIEADALAEEPDSERYTHYFKRPFTYEGRTVETLTFDWDTLSGRDSLAIERDLRTKNITLVIPAYTGEYLVGMAARACVDRTEEGKRFVGTDMIQAMPLGDFQQITKQARNFLIRAGL